MFCRQFIYFLLGFWLFSITQVVYAASDRVALVIGNSDYKDSPLKNPINDADSITHSLENLGFKVIHGKNLDRKQFRSKIRVFGEALKHSEVGLFYYAGHGLQYDGDNYLVPVKANIQAQDEIIDEAISANAVLRKMESAGNSVNIVILDACRNNPFARSFRSTSRGLTRMSGVKGSLIAYATSPGKVASDGTGDNGLYTQYLLKYMNQPNLKLEEVFKKVRISVSKDTSEKQIPWENSSLMGDFYFVKEKKFSTSTLNPLSFEINYVFRSSGKGPLLPIKQNEILHSGDHYKVIFTPEHSAYVYIFQVDSKNGIYQLFPLENINNPVKQGQTYTIPGKNKAFILDNQTGDERIFLVVSKERNHKIEQLYKTIKNNNDHKTNEKTHLELKQYLIKRRGMGGIISDRSINSIHWEESSNLFSIVGQKLKAACESCVTELKFQHQ